MRVGEVIFKRWQSWQNTLLFCSDFSYIGRKIKKFWRGDGQKSNCPEACWIKFPLSSFAHQWFSCEHNIYQITISTAGHWCLFFFIRSLLSVFLTENRALKYCLLKFCSIECNQYLSSFTGLPPPHQYRDHNAVWEIALFITDSKIIQPSA